MVANSMTAGIAPDFSKPGKPPKKLVIRPAASAGGKMVASRAAELIEGLSEFLADDIDDVDAKDPDEKEYVLLDQEVLNTRGLTSNPCAHCQHIFEVDDNGKINKSGCEKFEVANDYATTYGTPLSAPAMRQKAADNGRYVCGTCVSTLYGKDG